jgi:hypothetical protein
MLTTSSATHRGEGVMGAQGPKPQIVCPESRLGGEASKGLSCVQEGRHYAPTLNFE